MRILIIDTYYPGFLKSFYREHNTSNLNYKNHKRLLLDQCFGTSDYYTYNLNKIGEEAEDLIINDGKLQSKWAKENGLKVEIGSLWQKIQLLPLVHKYIGRPDWIQKIALAQIKQYKADIVYLQDLSILNPDTLKECKKYCKLLVGQIACPLPAEANLKCFDLILTSFPHYVDRFRKMGIQSEYFKIAFEKRILKKIKKHKRIYPLVFIGSFSPHHNEGTVLLEKLAKQVPIHIWGQGLQYLSPTSPLRKHYHGEAWGLSMYKILSQSKIVVNRHISVAENNANNMRLYESTGMGALLVTDKKKNLIDLFIPGKEVVEYGNATDLIEKVKFLLQHEKDRKKIALSGQKKTLTKHNYELRMKELQSLLKIYLKKSA